MNNEQVGEIKRYFGVVAEGLRNDIRQVAEGVTNVSEKLDREITALRDEMRTEFNEVKSMTKFPVLSWIKELDYLRVKSQH